MSTPFGTAETRSGSTPSTSIAVARSGGDTTTRWSAAVAWRRSSASQKSTMPPRRPPRRTHQGPLAVVEIGRVEHTGGERVRHPGQRRAEGGGQIGSERDRLEQLQLGAVQVGDHGDLGPAASHSVVLRREVVEMEHGRLVGAGRLERGGPDRGEVLGERGIDGGQQNIGRALPVLERGVHRNRCGDGAPAGLERPHRVAVVEGLQVDATEERAGMGLLARLAEGARHECHGPPGVAQRRGEVPRHLCRAAAGEEQQPHHHTSPGHGRTLRGPAQPPALWSTARSA